jgi:hypothetical protein
MYWSLSLPMIKTKLAFFLMIRITLMLIFQFITYLILFNKTQPFKMSGMYWATHITLVNLILLVIMIILFKRNDSKYFSFFNSVNNKNTIYFLKILIPLVITAMVPNIILSIWLYQDPQIGTTFLLGEIPLVFMIINLTIFPLLQGLVEIPFYFAFIMPKLKKITVRKVVTIGLPVFFLSIQHAFMPFRFDLTYSVYRSIMFFPFALFIGILIYKKPTMLPYLVILHILMNASLFMMYFIN